MVAIVALCGILLIATVLFSPSPEPFHRLMDLLNKV
jgi:hypothetical protein